MWAAQHRLMTFNPVFINIEQCLSPPQRLLFFKKPRKRGKGGKTGKAEKAREKGKSEESLCQISVEIRRPPGGWLCTAMPAC